MASSNFEEVNQPRVVCLNFFIFIQISYNSLRILHDKSPAQIFPKSSEALPVYNGWARLVVFLFGNPHLLEGGEGSQDGSSDPDRIFPLRWCNDLDLVSK